MDALKLMEERHSVRNYLNKPVPEDIVKKLEEKVKEVNQKSGLGFKIVFNEPDAFGKVILNYGVLKGVENYIICAGQDSHDFEEKYGYYGEELVLYLQSLGLNSCWVGLTVNKRRIKSQLLPGEKLGCVIAFGYGVTQGMPHKNKNVEKVTQVPSPWPQWFKDGVKGAMLAPTAVNQQKFTIELAPNGKVIIKALRGPYTKVDLGIVKYQFMLAAGEEFPGFENAL